VSTTAKENIEETKVLLSLITLAGPNSPRRRNYVDALAAIPLTDGEHSADDDEFYRLGVRDLILAAEAANQLTKIEADRLVGVKEPITNEERDARFVELLAVDGNGAVEAFLPSTTPLRVVLIGPIKTWWGRLESDEYKEYSAWRDAVRAALIYHGSLVYAPHRAWSGGWHESAQLVNDLAIKESDLVVTITPPGVESVGTDAEEAVAASYGIPVYHAPPAGKDGIDKLLAVLGSISLAFLSEETKGLRASK